MKTILATAIASLLSFPMLAQTEKPAQKRPIPPTSVPTSIPTGIATAQPVAPSPSPTPYVWQQEPKAFRGVTWGTSEKDAKAALKFGFCTDSASTIPSSKMRSCMSRFSLGSVSVTAIFQFMNDKFVAVGGHFPSEGYQTVRSAFVGKYGPPTAKSFEQEKLTWEGPEVAISLDRSGEKVTEGFFYILTQEFRAGLLKANEDRQKRLKDAL
jgi:hypothetical protein